MALGAAAMLAAPHIARAADDTIKIGVMTPLTGAAVESGKLQQNGIRIALEAVNRRGVLGRKFEVVTEDDQTTNPGATQGFERLAARPDIAAIVGPIRSAQVNAIEASVRKLGKPFMFGGTDPTLTQRGNPWLFRCRPNDGYSATIIAEFGFGQLQKQKWAVVFSAEAFGTNGSKALLAALRERSITPLTMQGFPNQTTDFTAVVDAVRASGADVLSTYIALETDLGLFAQQLRRAGLNLPWVGSPSICRGRAWPAAFSPTFITGTIWRRSPKTTISPRFAFGATVARRISSVWTGSVSWHNPKTCLWRRLRWRLRSASRWICFHWCPV